MIDLSRPPVRLMMCFAHGFEAYSALRPTDQLAAAWFGFNRAN